MISPVVLSSDTTSLGRKVKNLTCLSPSMKFDVMLLVVPSFTAFSQALFKASVGRTKIGFGNCLRVTAPVPYTSISS